MVFEMLPTLVAIGPLKIYSYGFFMFLGLFLGLFWWWRMGRDEHFDEVELFDSAFVAILVYFVVGRVVYVGTHWSDSSLLQVLAILTRPGLVPWVGIIGVFLTLAVISRVRKWDLWRVYDILVVALSVVLTFTSIGGLLNGSNPGKEMSFLSVSYVGVQNKIFPVDLIGVVWFFLTFMVVSRVRRNFRFYSWYKAEKSVARDGLATLIFGVSVGIYYLIRSIVDDTSLLVSGVSYMSILGLLLLIASVVSIIKFSGRSLVLNKGYKDRRRVSRLGSSMESWRKISKGGK